MVLPGSRLTFRGRCRLKAALRLTHSDAQVVWLPDENHFINTAF